AAMELALGVTGRATQECADARQNLLEMEGLGDVVVGAGVEALDLVAPAVAGGEDEHRHGPAGAPPRLEHRDAVHLGQADVEDHRVIGLAFAEKVALLAVEGTIDHVARIDERCRELAIEIGIVLDDEETQGSVLPTAAADAGSLKQNRRRQPLLCHYIRRGGRLRKGGKGRLRAAAGGRARARAPDLPLDAAGPCSLPSRRMPKMTVCAKAATSILLNALRTW